jgi:hypothetical protein
MLRHRHLRLTVPGLMLLYAASQAAAAPPPAHANESPALFGMGAQHCKNLVDVAAESNNREIALSGAMFSWAQGWFSARNFIGHESAPRVVGGTLAAEKLKSMLVEECRNHPDEPLYVATDELYERLAKKGW